jgi:opacity protein-like surface antigen
MKSTFSQRFSKHLILCAAILLSVGMKASAENYVGVQAGVSFANKVGGTKVDIDPNYADSLQIPGFLPPSIGQAIKGAKFTGADMTDTKHDESFTAGVKVGHYFDSIPFLGVEGELNYMKPDFLQQDFTTSNLNNPTLLTSNGVVTKNQLAANIHDFSGTASLMLRYPAFKRVTPYVGVGPSLHYIRIRGTGTTAMNTDTATEALGGPITPNVLVDGPPLKHDTFTGGLQAKAGIRFNVTKHLSADVEYKYNYMPVRLDPYRDLNNFRGTFSGHQIVAALVYRFGNIKW